MLPPVNSTAPRQSSICLNYALSLLPTLNSPITKSLPIQISHLHLLPLYPGLTSKHLHITISTQWSPFLLPKRFRPMPNQPLSTRKTGKMMMEWMVFGQTWTWPCLRLTTLYGPRLWCQWISLPSMILKFSGATSSMETAGKCCSLPGARDLIFQE